MRTKHSPDPRVLAQASLIALLSSASVATALAKTEIEPEISVGIAHTNNLTLVRDDPISETVYELMPQLGVTRDGPRITASANLRGELYRYADLEDTEVYSFFDGEMAAALDPENFFIDLGAQRKQTIADPQGRVAQGNLPISANRVDTNIYYFGPRLQYRVGGNVVARGSVRYSHTDYNGDQPLAFDTPQDFDDDTIDFSLDNYVRQRGMTWAVRYRSDKTQYEVFIPYEHRQATLELGGWVTTNIRVFAAGGKESAWDATFDPSLADNFWEGGFAVGHRDRFNMEMAAGERAFGSSRRVSLGLKLKNVDTRLSHEEEPQAQSFDPRSFGRELTPVELEDYLTRVASPERYLSKRSQWILNLTLGRTSVSFNAFDESREERVRLDGIALANESQKGGSVSVGRRVGARTEVSLAARSATRDFGDGNDRDLRVATLTVSRDVGSRTRVVLDVNHDTEDSNGLDAAFDYSEERVSLLLTRKF